jgi:hypothetical protein
MWLEKLVREKSVRADSRTLKLLNANKYATVMLLLGLVHCKDVAEKCLGLIAVISGELQTMGIEYNGGKCKCGVEKHGELSPDENDLKPVNIFKDTTQITKWFHRPHYNNETRRAVLKEAPISDLQFCILCMLNINCVISIGL